MTEWLLDFFVKANGPQNDTLKAIIEKASHSTDQKRVEELQSTFLIEARIHFQQYIFRLNEKCTSLESERDRL